MLSLLKIFINIILLRAGPQNLPSSNFLFKVSLILYFVVGIGVAWFSFTLPWAIGVSGLDTALLIALILVALRVRNLDNRITQTLTAALGTLGLFSIILLPIDAWYATLPMDQGSSEQLPALIMLILLAWSLAILGHILRHALDIPLVVAAGLSIFYLMLSLLLSSIMLTPL